MEKYFYGRLGAEIILCFQIFRQCQTIDELRSVMTDYVKMERDLQQFMVAVDNVKSIVSL